MSNVDDKYSGLAGFGVVTKNMYTDLECDPIDHASVTGLYF